jgi:tetratricopeptide (TPR) repeat protein
MTWEDRLLRAEGFLELQMYAEAAEELAEINSAASMQQSVLFLKYQLHSAMGQWKQARQATKHLTKLYPATPVYWLAHAACARQLGSVDAAESILNAARFLHPKDGPIWYALAACASISGRLEEARKLATRALQFEPRLQKRFLQDPSMRPIHDEIPHC